MIDQGSHFSYVSYIIWLLIHQNSDLFNGITLEKHEVSGSIKSVDRWIKEVKASTSYYDFVERFLVLAMSLFSQRTPRLSKALRLYLRMPQGEIKDWFFTKEGIFIHLYGFLGTLFLLPLHVTDQMFSIEYSRQMDYIDSKYGAVVKKRNIYALPHKVHDLLLQTRGGGDQLAEKLIRLRMKKINQYWLYDPKDIFGKKL